MSSHYDHVISVVRKSPADRTEAEALGIVGWFRKKSRLFSDLHSDIVCDIIRNCHFAVHQKDDVLIKQGDIGDCFYILLRGSVSIYILTWLSDKDGDVTYQRLENDDREDGETQGPLDRTKFGNFIVQLEEGQSFGELALISKDCIRNASIIVDETSDLLTVDRKLYNRSLKAAQMVDFEQRNQFVASCPLFRWWQPRYKRQLAYSIVKETVSFQEYICRQGQRADKIYFILSGQARILVNSSRHFEQYENLISEADTSQYNNYRKKLTSRQSILKRAKTAPCGKHRNISHRRNEVELCLIGFNEILGAGEFILGLRTYYQSVQATEACVAYSLDMKHYDRLIVRRHPQTLDLIRSTVRARLHNRIPRMNPADARLFRVLLKKLDDTSDLQAATVPLVRRKQDTPADTTPSFSPAEREQQRCRQKDSTASQPTEGPATEGNTHSNQRQEGRSEMKSFQGGHQEKNKPAAKETRDSNGNSTTEIDDKSTSTSCKNLRQSRNTCHDSTSMTEGRCPLRDRQAKLHEQGRVSSRSLQEYNYNQGQLESHMTCPSRMSLSNCIERPSLQSTGADDFHDWESSDLALGDLEIRIQRWLAEVSMTTQIRNETPRPFAMRRVTMENGLRPIPGAKVLVSRKPENHNNGLTFSGGVAALGEPAQHQGAAGPGHVRFDSSATRYRTENEEECEAKESTLFLR